jgi:hypothetical protein
MSEHFLQLSDAERSKILRALGPRLDRAPAVLEKDVWVCWVLQQLFTMPGRRQMAFKGGTSLSKVFGAIDRLSEDVDVTLDYRGLETSIDPFAPNLSKSQLKKFSESLKEFVRQHVFDLVVPYFRDRLATDFAGRAAKVEVSDDGEQVRIRYPTALGSHDDYLGNSVLLELGGRNITEPQEDHLVRPDIAPILPELEFPSAAVSVLSPLRTFWEKATLIHVECNRGEMRASAERLSRHWYDLAILADHPIGQAALADWTLLLAVVKHKKVFFNTSYANYDACSQGRLRLMPDEAMLASLREDFRSMVRAGMLHRSPPSFEQIENRLQALEAEINGDHPG